MATGDSYISSSFAALIASGSPIVSSLTAGAGAGAGPGAAVASPVASNNNNNGDDDDDGCSIRGELMSQVRRLSPSLIGAVGVTREQVNADRNDDNENENDDGDVVVIVAADSTGDELLKLTNLKLSDEPSPSIEQRRQTTAVTCYSNHNQNSNNQQQHLVNSGHHYQRYNGQASSRRESSAGSRCSDSCRAEATAQPAPQAPLLPLAATCCTGASTCSSGVVVGQAKAQSQSTPTVADTCRASDLAESKMLVGSSAVSADDEQSDHGHDKHLLLVASQTPTESSPVAATFHQLDSGNNNQSYSYSTHAQHHSHHHHHQQQQQQHPHPHRQMISASGEFATSSQNSGAGQQLHYSHQQQQQRSYVLDFAATGDANHSAYSTSFASDSEQRNQLSGDHDSRRLVSMDAEFADLTYSSGSAHFLSLDPVPSSGGHSFKVQELSPFELSLAAASSSSAAGTGSDQHHHHHQQQQHQQYHSQADQLYEHASSYASLYPANHSVSDGGGNGESVIRLGYPATSSASASASAASAQVHLSHRRLSSSFNSRVSTEHHQPFALHEHHHRDDAGVESPAIQLIHGGGSGISEQSAHLSTSLMLDSAGSSMLSQSQPINFGVSQQHQSVVMHHQHQHHQNQVMPNNSNHNQHSNQQQQHYNYQANHEQHLHHHHHQLLDLDQGLKVCEWEGCEHTFLDMQEFVKHLEDRHVNQEPKEKGRYFCLWSNCKRNEQEFNARYKLLIHMRVHSGEKPYPCNNINCKKSFSRLENLKIHQRSHTGEKPYKCNFDACSKSFTNSSDRIKHHKTHKDPKPYSCSFAECTKRYTDPSSLRKHLRTHKRPQLTSGTGLQQHQHRQHQAVPMLQVDQSQLVGFCGASTSAASTGCRADFDPALLFEPPPPPATCSSASTASHLVASSEVNASELVSEQTQQQHHYLGHLTPPPTTLIDNNEQDYHNQHWQLSRSWCAGSTPSVGAHLPSTVAATSRPFLLAGGELNEPQTSDYRHPAKDASSHSSATGISQHQQRHHHRQQRHHQLVAHETLMRSMPSQGLRSQTRHALAGWPPPPVSQRVQFRAPYAQADEHAHQRDDGPQQQHRHEQ